MTEQIQSDIPQQSMQDQKMKEAYFTASQGQLVWARFKKQRAAMIAARPTRTIAVKFLKQLFVELAIAQFYL